MKTGSSMKMNWMSVVRTSCILVLLLACHVEEDFRRKSNPLTETDVLKYIRTLGFPTSTIEEYEDFYLVEGDIIFSKIETPKSGRAGQAYVTTGLVNYFEIIDVTVTVDNSIPIFGVDNWRTEVQQAIIDWNTIENSRLHLVYTTSAPADVIVRSDANVLPAGTIASAEFPSAGLAGFQILVNLDYSSNFSVPTAQKRYNMVHEIGHTIGLRHTNWQSLGGGESTANQMPGTPCTDGNSVMNGGTATFSWNGFSDRDRTAGQVLYPIDRPAGTYYFLRYYQQSSGDHFYTIYFGERGCGAGGYVAEGIEGYIFQNQASGTVPIYRYWSGTYGDHFYTRTSGTYSTYVSEGISGYAYSTQVSGTIPIYVYYNSALQDHFYTRFNTTYSGYVSQGIAWYAIA